MYNRGRHALALLLILIAGLVAWLPGVRVPFHYDDLYEIVGNTALRDFWDWKTIVQYNPARALLMLTFAFDLHVWDPKHGTLPFHLENLAIHLINAVLVYRIAERLLTRRGEGPSRSILGLETPGGWAPALAITLIFTVHPVFVEAVTYIASRSSILATLFYLSAFAAYVRFRDIQAEGARGAGLWLILALNFYLLSIFTKEEGLSLPAVLLAYDLLLAPRAVRVAGEGARGSTPETEVGRPPRFWLGTAPFWAALVLLVIARVLFFGQLLPREEVRGIAENLFTALEVAVVYLRLFVAPYGLSVYHDYPVVTNPLQVTTLLAAAFHLGAVALAFALRRRLPLVSFGIAWYYITLSPTTSFVPLKEVMAEHRVYLAAPGLLLIAAVGLRFLRDRFRAPALVPGIALAIPLTLMTVRYNVVWQSDVALWERAVLLAPHSADAAYGLGNAWLRRGELERAEAAFKVALRNYERLNVDQARWTYNYLDALNNLGMVYARRGELDLAISYFRRSLNQNLLYHQGWYNLGFAQLQKGLFLEASFSFEEAVKVKEDYWQAHYQLGNLYYQSLSDPDKAARHYKRMLELQPAFTGADVIKRRLLELGY